jgi:hypothetical protein
MSGEVFEKTRKGNISGVVSEIGGGTDWIDSGSGSGTVAISVIPKKPVTCFCSTEKV